MSLKKLNVLFIVYRLERGGAETIAATLATGLNLTMFRPVVCSIRPGGDLFGIFKDRNIPVYMLNKEWAIDISIVSKIMRICKEEKINIVHTHNFSANLWGRLAAKLARVPCVVATEHSIATNKSYLQRLIDRSLSYLTDQIIAVSENVRTSHINAEEIARHKIVTIYNGIEIQEGNLAPDTTRKRLELGLSQSAPVVGIVGRLHPAKAHIYFLRAAKRILQVIPSTMFVIVGDGPLKRELMEYVAETGMKKNVCFLGFRHDCLEIINCFDVGVLSSIREGLPLTLLEYMAMKKPVVATAVGGTHEVVLDRMSGFLVPTMDVKALSESIITLLRDKNLAKNMGLRGHALVKQKFTANLMIKETERVYSQVLQRKKHCT